jgi:hypothetical protein
MSVAFVIKIKKDYVYVNECDEAENYINMLSYWFMDYDKTASWSSLGQQSSVEYLLTINNL